MSGEKTRPVPRLHSSVDISSMERVSLPCALKLANDQVALQGEMSFQGEDQRDQRKTGAILWSVVLTIQSGRTTWVIIVANSLQKCAKEWAMRDFLAMGG